MSEKAQGLQRPLEFPAVLRATPDSDDIGPPGVLTEQNSSSGPHPASLCSMVPGSPLPLGCGTALCRVPSSSPPGGALTRPAATSH